MKHFLKIAQNIDVTPIAIELARQPELWNRNPARLQPTGPHYQTDDIWLRYKDEAENVASGDWSNFADPHDPIWYPAYYSLQSCRSLIFSLMARVEGERLGGVLIYRVPPGKEILPHVDTGWHPNYYDKFNVAIKSQPGCVFHYKDEQMFQHTGDIFWFENNVEHWITNASTDDQIIMTVCIRTHKYGAR